MYINPATVLLPPSTEEVLFLPDQSFPKKETL
jgi:hypothetical protein